MRQSRCLVCTSALVNDADAALARGATGAAVARMLGVPRDSVGRHLRNGHAAPAPRQPAARPQVAPARQQQDGDAPLAPTDAAGQLDAIEASLDEALAGGELSPTMRLAYLAERRRAVESRARVLGPMTSRPVSYRDLEGWPAFEAAILGALCADCLDKVSAAVAALE